MGENKHPEGWPRVTSILGDYDMSWLRFFYKKHGSFDVAEAYSTQAKERGTRIHAAFEALLKGENLQIALESVEENEKRAVVGLDGWIRGAEVMSLREEHPVESKEHKYHGHFDHELIIQNPEGWVRKLDFFNNFVPIETPLHVLSDLKTQEGRDVKPSEIKKHAMQLSAYSQALKEETGEELNTGLIINVDIVTGVVDAVPIHPLAAYFQMFKLQRDLFDFIESEGKWEHLRRRKRVVSE